MFVVYFVLITSVVEPALAYVPICQVLAFSSVPSWTIRRSVIAVRRRLSHFWYYTFFELRTYFHITFGNGSQFLPGLHLRLV